jgi:hypothetical protein
MMSDAPTKKEISLVVFNRPPPKDDGDLLEKLCDEGGTEYLYLRFEERPINMPSLRRIIHLASDGAGMKVAKLHIQELSFLTGYEKPEFAGNLRGMQGLESASLSIKFQKNVWNQIRELTSALFDSNELISLSISIFEYPTDDFLNGPQYRALDKVFESNFAPMLGLSTQTERLREAEEEDGRRVGRLMAQAIMGPNMIQIRDAPESGLMMENIVGLQISHAVNPQIASFDPPPDTRMAMLTPRLAEVAVVRNQSSLAVRPARLSYLTRDQWDETVNAILDRPLPPSLRNVTLCLLMPKEPCTRFIESMANVESLNLSFCSIEAKSFARLAPAIARFMTHLKGLSMCRNDLSDAVDLASVVGPALQRLDLSFNKEIGGHAVTSLFRHMGLNGTTTTINYVNFANTRFRTSGLTFDGLDRALPDTHFVIPNLFSHEEVTRIQACLPDGSILELDGPDLWHGTPLLMSSAHAMTMVVDSGDDQYQVYQKKDKMMLENDPRD